MTDRDYDFICALLRAQSGVVLEPGKHYLVENRLAPLVRELDLHSVAGLINQLRALPSPQLLTRVTEALLTTETSFFRDRVPFDALRQVVLPELIQRRQGERCLNIWCAASSTGQEPYSLALVLLKHFPALGGWTVQLLASDLSAEALARARAGYYTRAEVSRGLPVAPLEEYFQRQDSAWQLRDEVRRLVTFREINLAQPWPVLPPMDLVLLRNVLIYFDDETKKSILARLARVLRPDGYLLLGGPDTTINLDDSYRRIEHHKTGFYQLVR
jgi:chemotaxis protein methyltransferase CheR